MDKEQRDHFDITPMHLAAWNGKTEILTELLNRGAAVDPKDEKGLTPFATAVEALEVEPVLVLLAAGANKRATVCVRC